MKTTEKELKKIVNKIFDNFGILTRQQVHDIINEYVQQASKKLEHHKNTTVGLWATDRPELVKDPQGVLFRIEF